MKTLRILTAMGALVLAQPALAQETAPEPPAPVVVDEAIGLPEWATIFSVFSHPRCANCHVADDHPRWSGASYGKTRFHGFNVQRGTDGSGFGNPGLRCTTCHGETNAPVPHGPPGAPAWHLAPAEMVWFEQSSAAICAQIKDPARNGGRTLEEIALHVRDDKLVGWGWAPGPLREPAPGSAESTYEALVRWTAAGAPCPQG